MSNPQAQERDQASSKRPKDPSAVSTLLYWVISVNRKTTFFIILSLPWTFALLLAAQAVLPKASIDRSNSSSCTLKCPNLTPIFLTPECATKTTRHICKAWGTHLTVPRLDKVVPLDGLPANHTIEQNQRPKAAARWRPFAD